ncbi:MAG TPA: DUF2306 domain-containing protein [Candidatus Sulfotelmatobacter sp.]|nr:DUF2306 domain-containing protein [Candidatus Sulfotelmatobacter sp.]
MAHASVPDTFGVSSGNRAKAAAKFLGWAGIVVLAVLFVLKYVLFYFRHYDPTSFDPYWPRRGWLFLHITAGSLALLTGPMQFWTGLRRRNMTFHRWTGRIYLLGVGTGIIGAVGLSLTTTFDFGVVNGIRGLVLAWFVTSGMAYFTIRKGLVSFHKEWMIRSYVVTFAFVTFRFLQDYSPLSRVRPEGDRDTTIAWACWVVPLAITEMVFQLRRLGVALAARQSP